MFSHNSLLSNIIHLLRQ